MKYEYGSTVRIRKIAPKMFRPDELGEIVGITKINSEQLSSSYKLPLGTKVLYVEFSDGTAIEIPEEFIDIQTKQNE